MYGPALIIPKQVATRKFWLKPARSPPQICLLSVIAVQRTPELSELLRSKKRVGQIKPLSWPASFPCTNQSLFCQYSPLLLQAEEIGASCNYGPIILTLSAALSCCSPTATTTVAWLSCYYSTAALPNGRYLTGSSCASWQPKLPIQPVIRKKLPIQPNWTQAGLWNSSTTLTKPYQRFVLKRALNLTP